MSIDHKLTLPRGEFSRVHTSGRGEGEDDSPGVGGFGCGERKVEIAILCTERAREENLVRTYVCDSVAHTDT